MFFNVSEKKVESASNSWVPVSYEGDSAGVLAPAPSWPSLGDYGHLESGLVDGRSLLCVFQISQPKKKKKSKSRCGERTATLNSHSRKNVVG